MTGVERAPPTLSLLPPSPSSSLPSTLPCPIPPCRFSPFRPNPNMGLHFLRAFPLPFPYFFSASVSAIPSEPSIRPAILLFYTSLPRLPHQSFITQSRTLCITYAVAHLRCSRATAGAHEVNRRSGQRQRAAGWTTEFLGHMPQNPQKHQWSSGGIHRCHRCDLGWIPG